MKIRLFISRGQINVGDICVLDKNQSHYLKNVLRLGLGGEVFVFNNLDGEFLAKIIVVGKSVEINITEKVASFYSSPNIGLVFSPVKNVKSEYIVTKATELGVRVIQPVRCERTIVTKVNHNKLQLNAIEAAEQSRRVDLPLIEEIKNLESFLKGVTENDIIILADESGDGDIPEKLFSKIHINRDSRALVIIGPEGGFSDKEREMMKSIKNTYSMVMGPRILRADTAIIASLMILQNYIGDIENKPSF